VRFSDVLFLEVRLPVGYWNLGPDEITFVPPFEKFAAAYNTSLIHIHKLFQLADKYGLGILIDIHGAPGSQNGADHSGSLLSFSYLNFV
jgi:aryl-phospho-beta-D-glucosidase BglC (GH1 family)